MLKSAKIIRIIILRISRLIEINIISNKIKKIRMNKKQVILSLNYIVNSLSS